MDIALDPAKNARNVSERNLPFERVVELEWDKAIASADERNEYGEHRIVALAPNGRLYAVCYTVRGKNRRIISFRKADKREDGIKATGRGYNARVERVLREALAAGKLDAPPGDLFEPTR